LQSWIIGGRLRSPDSPVLRDLVVFCRATALYTARCMCRLLTVAPVPELIPVVPPRDGVDGRPKSEMNDPRLVPSLLNISVTPDIVERKLVARELGVSDALERELLVSDRELVMLSDWSEQQSIQDLILSIAGVLLPAEQ
jgi:hypothetical protein